jgi:signal transduction histidine kinase
MAMHNADAPLAQILIVDDEASIMNALCETLRDHHYAATGFTSASQALAAMRQTKFDLLLADLMMPEMDGIALIRRALEIDHDIVPVIITGAGTVATAVEAMQAGALDYILKPFKLTVVLLVLTRALTVRRLRLENLELQQHVRQRTAQLEFFSVVSHELRTPLSAINGWVHLLRGGALSPEKTAHAFEVIERNVKLQMQITDNLLDVSRMITGKLQVVTRPTSMPAVIDAAVETVRPAANAKGIQLIVSLDRSVEQVAGDVDRLQQVAWNLLINAIKFTPTDGRVEIRLEQGADGSVELSVSDTGQGIRAEFLPHIFDHFRQQDASPTRRYGGLGLGLSIVGQLVELHGGTVTASSEGEGRGSAFVVRLPGIRQATAKRG